MSGENVKACPDCGRLVLISCWHDENIVRSRPMRPELARKLRLDYRRRAIEELDEMMQPGDLDSEPETLLVEAARKWVAVVDGTVSAETGPGLMFEAEAQFRDALALVDGEGAC